MLRRVRVLLLAACGVVPCMAIAEEEFPETITLEYALQRAETNHPDIEQARAAVELAESERLEAESLTGTNVAIKARLRYVEPNDIVVDQTHNDSSVGLFVNKNLYDFGRSDAANRAASSAIRGEKINLGTAHNSRRLDIMRHYFDVILADLEYLRDNEDMATAFVSLDKARDRRELGLLSDVELLDFENRYQLLRLKRYRSDNKQRSSRAALAVAMNQPGKLPATLTQPVLPSLKRKLPELEQLQKVARENNTALTAAKAQLQAAQARLDVARAGDGPVLSGEFEVSENNRSVGTRDEARIGLQLNVPLSTGGKTRAQIAAQNAAVRSARAHLAKQRALIDQVVLETWLELANLAAQHQQAVAQLDYSELYLDQRRALYELETQTDLGDAMVQISEAQRHLQATEFDIAYQWARLDSLMGKKVYSTPAGEIKK